MSDFWNKVMGAANTAMVGPDGGVVFNDPKLAEAYGRYNAEAGENFAQCFAAGPGAFKDTGLGDWGKLPCGVGIAGSTLLTRGASEAVQDLIGAVRFGRSLLGGKKGPGKPTDVPEEPACTSCGPNSKQKPSEKAPTKTKTPLDPTLRSKVDELQPGDVMRLERGGKDGLLDYLSQQKNEYGIFRDDQGMYLTTSGMPDRVYPKMPGDQLIFHNHPGGTEFLSGTYSPEQNRWLNGDRGYIQDSRPDQRSTLLGTPNGVTRQSVGPPKAVNWDEIDRLLEGINPSR